MPPSRLLPLSLLVFAFLLPLKAAAQIYANVQVTGGVSGTFTVTLEHQKAPGAVANFIGLATGQHGWLDQATGAIRYTPFYDGIIFHRVIAGFMNQTGSKAGDGTDGPGYTFRDEFDATLRHDAAYTVSMANSGKHTNGSQFFVTAAATPWLNDIHTVFGRVTTGTAIIDQINATPTTADRPLTPISIQSVSIYGPSLAAFNLDPAWLPKLRNARPILQKSGPTFTLASDRLPFSEYAGWNSPNIAVWAKFSGTYFGATAPAADLDVTSISTGPAHYYRLARVDYSTAKNPFMPPGMGSRSFTFTSNFFPSSVAFDAAGTGGTWTLQTNPPGNGTIAAVTYTQTPYLPSLYMRWNSTATYGFDLEFLYKLNYTSANAGTFTGQSNVNGYTNNIVGTFTTLP